MILILMGWPTEIRRHREQLPATQEVCTGTGSPILALRGWAAVGGVRPRGISLRPHLGRVVPYGGLEMNSRHLVGFSAGQVLLYAAPPGRGATTQPLKTKKPEPCARALRGTVWCSHTSSSTLACQRGCVLSIEKATRGEEIAQNAKQRQLPNRQDFQPLPRAPQRFW